MSERKRIVWLIVIMASVGVIGGGGTVFIIATAGLGEVTAPFIFAGAVVVAVAVGVNVAGGVVFYRITSPIIEDLHVSEKRFHSVTDAATDAIIAIKSSGEIVSWNLGAAKIFGYAEDEILGAPLLRLIPECQTINTAKTKLAGETMELSGVHKNGREFPLELSLGSWMADGETFVTWIIRDITLRKQIETQLIQSEKMAAIGTMTSGIGHEINNPLYAIFGLAETIMDSDDMDKSRAQGGEILKHTKHISEIVKNLSGYVRPAQSHELKPTDINKTIAEATAMVRLQRSDDDMEIKETLDTIPSIPAKKEEIQQIFFNVIRNGVQAMEGKGTLNIESRLENGYIIVQVKDTGIGIDGADLQKIFDPFFTTKDPDEGEGLGLFVVKKIVTKYSGTINFESVKGSGTTCTIQFPVGDQVTTI